MSKIKTILFSLLLCSSLLGQKVDIVSNFELDQLSPSWKIQEETGLEVRSFSLGFELYLNHWYTADIEKIIFMNDLVPPQGLAHLPKENCLLFCWEPAAPNESYCALFSKIYTYNDDLVDSIRYFKFYYPVLIRECLDLHPFESKKLCVMIAHTPSKERVQMVEFFHTKPLEEFDLYGFSPLIPTDRYRGKIAGHPLSREKLFTLNQYRFCLCFENSFINGYITEKIFSCFAAGCIPVYLGAPNVEKYIPKECFIDFRDFSDAESLYRYLKEMSKESYLQYLANIRDFLNSEKAALFSAENFNQLLLEAVNKNIVAPDMCNQPVPF
jgi:hypothetical protein